MPNLKTIRPVKPEHFINRELSWLEFNQRVLNEALNPGNPLLERLKFFCIASSNLDEFFEVRVAGLKQQIESDIVTRSMDGLTATESFQAVVKRVRRFIKSQYDCWNKELLPMLARHNIKILNMQSLSPADLEWLEHYYRTQVRAVLTPLSIDPAHPFPQLLNKSLNLIIEVEKHDGERTLQHLAVVQVPRVLPQLVRLPRTGSGLAFVPLSQFISFFLSDLFPGTRIRGFWHFRVTRNSELYIDEEETANLLKAVEQELHNRRKGDAVRLEIDAHCPYEIRTALLRTLKLDVDDLYMINGPLNPGTLMQIYQGDHSPELRDKPFVAPNSETLRNEPDMFSAITRQDILLHHPYENFSSVVELLEQASEDPDVLAIKQTLYRTGGDTRIVGALMNAVNHGKQVTAIVELRARFDEANNIEWSRRLEEAGVHVVYGLVGYKIHAKTTLIVRREGHHLKRYVHIATGNYNPNTARLYTDIGILTCREEIGEDVTNLFNLLTGICQYQGMKKLLIAPFELHARMMALIERETTNASNQLPARIIAKMNSLVDEQIILALYRASQAGVKITLIVRGICCLRPGLKRISENITVLSIVDRFLEHSRIFYFENACQPEIYIGSADWMPRNFFKRIEVIVPVEDGNLRDRLINEIIATTLADNQKARLLNKDGTYVLRQSGPGEESRRSQLDFIDLALEGELRHQSKKKAPKKIEVKLASSPHKNKGGRNDKSTQP